MSETKEQESENVKTISSILGIDPMIELTVMQRDEIGSLLDAIREEGRREERERSAAIIRTGLERMRMINGNDCKCVYNDIRDCANHSWINEATNFLDAPA